jgi:hypothetical protein
MVAACAHRESGERVGAERTFAVSDLPDSVSRRCYQPRFGRSRSGLRDPLRTELASVQVIAGQAFTGTLVRRCRPIEGPSHALLVRGDQSRGLTMNHSTNSAHRFSSSKRNVHRFQKKSPFA